MNSKRRSPKTKLKEKPKVVSESTSSTEKKLPRQSVLSENLTGIRIRGVKVSTEKDSQSRQEHNLSEIRKMLVHLDLNAEIGDIVRLGTHEENKNRTILLKIPSVWQRHLILASAKTLKLFVSCVCEQAINNGRSILG